MRVRKHPSQSVLFRVEWIFGLGSQFFCVRFLNAGTCLGVLSWCHSFWTVYRDRRWDVSNFVRSRVYNFWGKVTELSNCGENCVRTWCVPTSSSSIVSLRHPQGVVGSSGARESACRCCPGCTAVAVVWSACHHGVFEGEPTFWIILHTRPRSVVVVPRGDMCVGPDVAYGMCVSRSGIFSSSGSGRAAN